ncbi:response regulator transcription factor [Chloroflexus sp.]|uniref:response regulator transcription factor n=1 Tax=Chloroflexus sp. TaxID=1904827 RepID=UPI002FD91390
MSVTTLIIVHTVSLFRDGLRLALAAAPHFQVIGEASNGQQAIQLVDQVDPDMVLMDINLPGIHGLEVARVIKRSHPHIAIILFGPVNDGSAVVKAIRAGVSAFVPANVDLADLLETLQQVRRGEYPINDIVLSSPEVAATVLEAFRQMVGDEEAQAVFSPLSSRELEVLELVAAGRTNREIASQLDISNQTVKNHISSILRKLAVNDRTQAVVYAMRRGWIKVALPNEQ